MYTFSTLFEIIPPIDYENDGLTTKMNNNWRCQYFVY